MMPLNHILRKCTGGYKLSKSQEKNDHLIYMNDTGGARSVMVIVVGNEHGDTSSNPEPG